MAEHAALVYLRGQMVELGQYSYLACYAADRVSLEYPEAIAAAIPVCIPKLCRDLSSLHGGNDDIRMEPAVVRQRLDGLHTWLIQSLLIRLDTLLHGVLDALKGRASETDSQPIETDIPRAVRDQHDWAYKDVVLLAVYRNCVVHASGRPPVGREQRLLDAGWGSREEAIARIEWDRPRYDDFLRMKKAVRTIASACIHAVGSP